MSKRVEHIQYPGLWVVSMELQALEWIRSQMHHVLLPRGLHQHAHSCMNDNLVQSVRDMFVAQVRQLVSDLHHLAPSQPRTGDQERCD